MKQNKCPHQSRSLNVPPLPTRLRGLSGCLFARATFDDSVGVEVYLAVLEEPSWCLPLVGTRPFKVFCKSGLARTHSGTVVFLIWRVAGDSEHEVVHEHFLNPYKFDVIQDLSALAQQTHLKVLVINSTASEVVDWFEFENQFKFPELLLSSVEAIGTDFDSDFDSAMEEFKSRYSVEEILRAE